MLLCYHTTKFKFSDFCRMIRTQPLSLLKLFYFNKLSSVQPNFSTKHTARVKPSQYIAQHLYEQTSKSNCSSPEKKKPLKSLVHTVERK